MKRIILIYILSFSPSVFAVTFQEAISNLEKHESIEAIIGKSRVTSEQASENGSWGDPHFKIAAKNFPKDTLDKDQTPMTGIEFGLSQKISLTTKYGNIKDAFSSLAKAYKYDANDKREALTKTLWEVLILKRKILEESIILNENQAWITKMLKVSKKLYANGKTSQQAILDIQIRISEIEILISNKKFELSEIDDKLKYLIGTSIVEAKSVPWNILNEKSKDEIDNRSLSFQEKLKATEFNLTASNLNYVPDLTVSLGVTKRENIDGNGDFVGASISFPLPFSDTKYASKGKAVQEKYLAVKTFENYKKEKTRNVAILRKEIKKLDQEINILKNRTIQYANNSRSITSKSYALGNSSYVELLQSELKLQKILMQKLLLEATRDINKVALKYVLGETIR
ncbi:MAG: outer membrane protein TolC [Bacteriovoracaceae bacterium]|jgi:cobalt-zinc-cadmium efflux system outer membrane protein